MRTTKRVARSSPSVILGLALRGRVKSPAVQASRTEPDGNRYNGRVPEKIPN
jgi:hypothetical protein